MKEIETFYSNSSNFENEKSLAVAGCEGFSTIEKDSFGNFTGIIYAPQNSQVYETGKSLPSNALITETKLSK